MVSFRADVFVRGLEVSNCRDDGSFVPGRIADFTANGDEHEYCLTTPIALVWHQTVSALSLLGKKLANAATNEEARPS